LSNIVIGWGGGFQIIEINKVVGGHLALVAVGLAQAWYGGNGVVGLVTLQWNLPSLGNNGNGL
jgi:hypothetical protein